MVRIYYLDLYGYEPTEEIIAGMLPSYRERYLAAKLDEIRMQSLGSSLLLTHVLNVHSEEQLVRGEHGKLIAEEFCFNLSHSEYVTVLAVADSNLGVDLECVRKLSEPIVRRCFPEHWKRELSEAASSEQDKVFSEKWTQLEAMLKADGRGLQADPGNHPEVLSGWNVRTCWHRDHCISCAMKEAFEMEIIDVEIANIVD